MKERERMVLMPHIYIYIYIYIYTHTQTSNISKGMECKKEGLSRDYTNSANSLLQIQQCKKKKKKKKKKWLSK